MITYTKRFDSRKFDETRPMEAKVGVIKRADGSAMFKIGKTVAIAAVYGPKALHPTYMRNPEKGILRCNYNMMAFSGTGERIRPGPGRRSREISLVTEKALASVLDLSEFPNTVIDVFIELIQTDSGTRCAGITAAIMALADAGLIMKDMIASVSVGVVGGKVLADLNKEEEDFENGAVDIPIAITHKDNKITLLQLDGLIKKEQLYEALELAKGSCAKIHELQRKALMEKFTQNGI
ncbi:exosome complex exonuclease Rrp41 [Candidatus Woesearchaeota archaeon]|nr:exosome complex exonuclease Rrp41 [Candidatus Woesearchaeota archaeon]